MKRATFSVTFFSTGEAMIEGKLFKTPEDLWDYLSTKTGYDEREGFAPPRFEVPEPLQNLEREWARKRNEKPLLTLSDLDFQLED